MLEGEEDSKLWGKPAVKMPGPSQALGCQPNSSHNYLMTVSGKERTCVCVWIGVGWGWRTRMSRHLTNSYNFFFFKHLRMLCFYMLENTNHKSCWISATAVWSLETAFLSMGGRDRQKSRPRQAAAPGREACSYRKLEWKEMMTSRAKCLCHEGAKALALWSLCMRKHDQWQGLNFPPFLELKYKGFLVIFINFFL